MSYEIYEIPSGSGDYSDIVVADAENIDAPAYIHYAYTIGSSKNEGELKQRRTIPLRSIRDWEYISKRFPEVMERFEERKSYYPGESVFSANFSDPDFHAKTVLRLGALEVLANIFSGRITASDKDPFPHQLSLQQYMKTYQDKQQHLLIADEVGLGKTIEIGLVLRDLLIAKGRLDQFRCLYLTSGGLREDVRLKLESVIQGAIDGQNIVQVVDSFIEYGRHSPIYGIHVASMHAARLYVGENDQRRLPDTLINPEILIIDECHHCASEGSLNNRILNIATTETYKAAYKLVSGTFWSKSEPPKIVVFMSATPFRSQSQFLNLLRLLNHNTSTITNAYSDKISEGELISNLQNEGSPVAVVWRQQDDVRNWNGERLFPNLSIKQIPLETNPEYLRLISEICDKVKAVSSKYKEIFGGFAVRQLEIRLTSSSVAGACWIFRWCVRHQRWDTRERYRQDRSDSTNALREFIRKISQRLAQYDKKNTSSHADIFFPSDDFTFTAKSIAPQTSNIPEIYDLNRKLLRNDDEDNNFIAESSDILELTQLGLKLLDEGSGVENSKLNWLREILGEYPDSRFLLFAESLQTCEIITKALPAESGKLTGNMSTTERERIVSKFRNLNNTMRILVATSAADEGFDFQVANRVIHWDLSPSPAVLMQRNGRVARLGQIVDVTAYYLIMEGTHEEKREKALQERFIKLGITDERLRLKILGSISKEEEENILKAIEENALHLIDSILGKAKTDNENMEKRLKQLQKELKENWVIDREKFANRLEQWIKLGIPPYIRKKLNLNLKFETVTWMRPVFRDVTSIEETLAKVAVIQSGRRHKKITFDPEFKVFGQDTADPYSLAGLRPWTCTDERGRGILKYRPDDIQVDPIGNLASSLARQCKADFTVVSANNLYEKFPNITDSKYLLFATHPIRELETNSSDRAFCYLTFYAFKEDLTEPIYPKGASAEEVYCLISLLEEQVVTLPLDGDIIEKSKKAGRKIGDWLKNSRQTREGFIQKGYFLPIPVALIAVV